MISQTQEKARMDSSRLEKLSHKTRGYKSPLGIMIYQKEIQQKEEEEKLKEEEKKKIQERVHSYSRYVKEMYYP